MTSTMVHAMPEVPAIWRVEVGIPSAQEFKSSLGKIATTLPQKKKKKKRLFYVTDIGPFLRDI